jgi:hypothetical protein
MSRRIRMLILPFRGDGQNSHIAAIDIDEAVMATIRIVIASSM